MSQIQIVRGFPFPNAPWVTKKHIEEGLDYVPHDGDIIIASYPKTGTNWLSYIVLQIISKGDLFPSLDDSIYKPGGFLEITGTAVLDKMESPRLYKYHFRYDMVQKNNRAKYLYIYRKPEDIITSYYHYMYNLRDEPHNIDEFFKDFISGNIAYGHYFDHVLSFFAHKNDENLLLISYEKLLRSRKEEVLRIAKFLGEEYFHCLSEDDSLLEKILERTSFDYMKKNLYCTYPRLKGEDGEPKKVQFFRKGAVGDGKKSLSSDQLKRLKDMVIERLKGTSLVDEWTKD